MLLPAWHPQATVPFPRRVCVVLPRTGLSRRTGESPSDPPFLLADPEDATALAWERF